MPEKSIVNINQTRLAFQIGLSLDETVREKDVDDLLSVFGAQLTAEQIATQKGNELVAFGLDNSEWRRTGTYLTQAVFNSHHSESQIMRYIKALENKDISLVHSMIALVTWRVY